MQRKGWKKLLKSMLGAASALVKKPVLFLPSVIAAVVIVVLSLLFGPLLESLALNVLILERIPEAGIAALPFRFAALYAVDLFILVVFAALAGIVTVSLAYWYAAFFREEGKAPFMEVCRETVGAVGKALGLVVFVVLVALLVGVLLWLFAVVESVVPVLGMVLAVLLALAVFYLFIKLAFTVQVLAVGKGTVKQALQQSWGFVQGRTLQVLVFLVVLAVIYQVVVGFGQLLSEMALDEMVELGSVAVFWVVAASWANSAMAKYYLGKK